MPKLTREEKQSELKRLKDILFVTVDYIILQIESEGLSKNDFEVIADYYKQQKQQIEKYFQISRLDILQRRLHSLILFPIRKADLTFNEYVKERTGYEIDIFEGLRIHIEEIIAQNKITNKKQLGDVFTMMEIYRQTSVDQKKRDILENLLKNYASRLEPTKTSK